MTIFCILWLEFTSLLKKVKNLSHVFQKSGSTWIGGGIIGKKRKVSEMIDDVEGCNFEVRYNMGLSYITNITKGNFDHHPSSCS